MERTPVCGFVGVYGLDGDPPDLPASVFAAMTDAAADRGPDGRGELRRGPVWLGHRRLAIRDRAGGPQPWVEGGRRGVAVVFNGEIYNDDALREELTAAGLSFVSRCDTEVIPAAYRRWGDDFTHRCDGMFAVGLVDFAAGRLLLVRDRFGIKPLFYTRVGRTLVFGSTLPSLLRHPGVSKRPDPAAVTHYLATLRPTLGERTLYADIKTLRPGERLIAERGEVRVERWYAFPERSAEAGVTLDEAAGRLQGELSQAVKLRLRSDVPVGMFQSGGVDSGVVATLAAEARGGALPAGCAVGSGAEGDLEAARATTRFLETDLRAESVDAESYFATWCDLVAWTGQPLATPTDVLLHRLAVAMRRDVGVVLGGEGADELLLGYASVARGADDFDRLRLIAADVSGLPRSAERVFLRSLKASLGRDDLGALGSPVELYFAANSLVPLDVAASWLRPEVGDAGGVVGAIKAEYERFFPADRPTGHGYAELLHGVNLETLLGRLDRSTMSAGLEARVPFASHRVVEAAAGWAGDLKLKVDPGEPAPFLAGPHLDARGSLEGKRVLRRMADELLPSTLARRPKASFPTPVAGWLAGAWGERLAERVRGGPVVRELFGEETAEALADHLPSLGMRAWPVANLALWDAGSPV